MYSSVCVNSSARVALREKPAHQNYYLADYHIIIALITILSTALIIILITTLNTILITILMSALITTDR